MNRILFIHDNLRVMRGLDSNSVDLIATDPPFNAKRSFNAPLGSRAAKQRFDDRWQWDDVAGEWKDLLAIENPAIERLVETAVLAEGGSIDTGTREVHTGRTQNSVAAFVVWLAPRVIEMKRILKPGGSLYLHCDSSADAYLRLLVDAVFGRAQFLNSIVWKRTAGRTIGNRYGRVHDTILYYAKAGAPQTWNRQFLPHDPAYVERAYRNTDERGRWQADNLTAQGIRHGESGQPWRGIDVTAKGRFWTTPTQGGMCSFIVEHGLIPGWPDAFPSVHERLDALDEAGLILWPKSGQGTPRLKRYLASTRGRAVEDVFSDIGKLEAQSKEKIGWATQKPLALYRRIIQASSNEGDLVLDPFAGCATTCVAAEQLQRQWVGIDIDPVAEQVTMERLRRETGIFGNDGSPVRVRKSPPTRSDTPTASPASMRDTLWNMQARRCANPYCDAGDLRAVDLELDHRIPKVRGGADVLENRIGLCGNCNRRKGKRAWGDFLAGEAAEAARESARRSS